MLSRIADSLYWLHRYMERADGLLRLLKTSYILSFDRVQANSITWEPALKIFTQLTDEEIDALKKNNAASLQYLLIDTNNHNSLRVLVNRARENARGVQDQITKEVWEQVNQLYHLVNNPAISDKLAGPDAIEVIDAFINSNDQFIGITDSTMPRGSGWNYMNLGKYTERCLLTVEYTHHFFKKAELTPGKKPDILFWRSLLLALSGYELHLKNYNNLNHNYNITKQVFFDKHFPRSVNYSLSRAQKYLDEIAAANPIQGSKNLKRLFGRTYSQVQYADPAIVAEEGYEKYLGKIRQQLNEFSRQLGQLYFSYA